MADWEEAFDSPLLHFSTGVAGLSWFAIFLFGQVTGANLNYIILLMVGTALGLIAYITVGGLPDWPEDVKGGQVLLGTGLGFAGIVMVSLFISGALGRPTSAIWVPQTVLPLQAGEGSAQAFLDLAVLGVLVAPAERGMVALGGLFTKATRFGMDQPLYLQPGFLASGGLWAGYHVVFGQNPWWFFFVALAANQVMLWAAEVAGDYSAAVFAHGFFDVAVKTARLLTGGLMI